jgi:uncharacterized protein (DUF58 family)
MKTATQSLASTTLSPPPSRTRRRTAFTREGWQYLVIFLLVFFGALINDINLLLILGGMLACPLLLSHYLAKRTLSGLVVQRRLPRAVCAGDLLVVHVAIVNTRRRLGGWVLVLEDTVSRVGNGRANKRNGTSVRPSVLIPYIAARQTASSDYRGRLAQRGRYSLGPMQVSTRFPFGLFRYSFTCGTTATLTVLPRLGRLTQSWRALRHESFAGSERRELRPGIDDDFYGLRPWQRGDSRRWVHWRATARTGEVMVRQLEQPHSRDAAIVLDLWQPPAPDDAQLDNVELAVSFAATLAAELCRTGSSEIFLVAADPEPRLTGGPGSAALMQDIMERLALIEAGARDRVPELLQLAAARIEPGTEIVLISTRPLNLANPAYEGRLPGEVVRRLTGRGMRVVDTSSENLPKYFVP